MSERWTAVHSAVDSIWHVGRGSRASRRRMDEEFDWWTSPMTGYHCVVTSAQPPRLPCIGYLQHASNKITTIIIIIIARHHVFNDIIWRAVGAAGIPAVKEPSGLDRQDGKRPDGLTLIPWHGVCSLVWDVTVVSPLAAPTLTEQP